MYSIENINLNNIKNDKELKVIEKELQKRLDYPYNWNGKKQSDENDKKTNFIYKILSFDKLLEKMEEDELSDDLKQYALNRWYNFVCAKACEYIIATSTYVKVKQNTNYYSKTVDFFLEYNNESIPFDHKNSNFPKALNNDCSKEELINWLYENQSYRSSTHYKSKFFIVYKNEKIDEQWKMKCNLTNIKKHIKNYFKHFNINNLIKFNGNVFSDVIIIAA